MGQPRPIQEVHQEQKSKCRTSPTNDPTFKTKRAISLKSTTFQKEGKTTSPRKGQTVAPANGATQATSKDGPSTEDRANTISSSHPPTVDRLLGVLQPRGVTHQPGPATAVCPLHQCTRTTAHATAPGHTVVNAGTGLERSGGTGSGVDE